MDKFGTLKVCPKCGEMEFRNEFKEGYTIIGASEKPIDIPDKMYRICRSCDYKHAELPLDAERTEK